MEKSDVSEAEKRDALKAVLASTSFARSAQMRAFLKYVCEREIADQAKDLTEYQIALNVLGRAKDFNVSDDSSVRNRAYELRQRLDKFYSTEKPGLPLEIHIPRGAYTPTYLRRPDAPVAEVETVAPTTARGRRFGIRAVVLLALACIGIGAITGFYFGRPHPAAIVKEAWGPLVDPREDLLISIAANLHMIVRQHVEPESVRFLAPPEATGFYGSVRRPLEPGLPLYMQPAQFSIPLAEVAATTTLCHVRQSFGGGYQLLPEAEAPISALRGRNSILIGSGTNSSAAAVLLRSFRYTIDFTSGDHFAVIDQRKPNGQNAAFVVKSGNDRLATEHYGLITVISSLDSSGSPKRTLVISGSASAGVQGATEYFSSAVELGKLRDRFRNEGLSGFPANYQVVVRCRTSGVRLVSYEYLTDSVLQTQ